MTKVLTVFTTPRYRQLLWELIKREISQRYKQSLLGYLWVIAYPLIQMVVLSFIFSQILPFQGDFSVPFSVFLFAGLLPWTLFSNSLLGATSALVENTGLIAKIYFPREVLLISCICGKIFEFFFSSLVFIVMMIVFKITPTWNLLWIIPIFLIQNTFVYGLSLFTSAINLFYRDIQYLVSLVVTLWLFLTPVFYSLNMFSKQTRALLTLNPMTILIGAYREVILGGQIPNIFSLGVCLLVSICLVLSGFWLFKKLEGQFADAV